MIELECYRRGDAGLQAHNDDPPNHQPNDFISSSGMETTDSEDDLSIDQHQQGHVMQNLSH
eukprot:scaffold105442_cov20-Prasinocladus_malaysianus.AAC.1